VSLIELRDVRVEAGTRCILDVVVLDVHAGEVLVVLGPTGAGKSTLLRILGLLERPAAGEVRWRGAPVHWPVPLGLRRRVTMAFQDPLLFSGTAAENVEYGLRVRGVSKLDARAQAMAMLRQLEVAAHAEQKASTLSGGEAQRVALARALVIRPELLLLDEPLASLDEPLREELGHELLTLIKATGLTSVLVTHDRTAARTMADRIAILDGGRLRQVGTPEEIFSRPADDFVARFVGRTASAALRSPPARSG